MVTGCEGFMVVPVTVKVASPPSLMLFGVTEIVTVGGFGGFGSLLTTLTVKLLAAAELP